MAPFRLFFPSVGSTSDQYLFHKYILGPSWPLNCSNFANTANLPAWATLIGLIFSRLGRILAHLGSILAVLAHLGSVLVPSWPEVAPSWAHSGPILAPSCPILAYLGPVFEVPRTLSIGLLSRASGQEASCLQFLASLFFFLLFGRDLFFGH